MCFHLAKNLKIKIHDWMMVLFFIKNCKVGNIFWQKAKTVPNYKKISTILKKKKKDNWQWVQSNSPWLGCLGSFLTLLSQFFFFFFFDYLGALWIKKKSEEHVAVSMSNGSFYLLAGSLSSLSLLMAAFKHNLIIYLHFLFCTVIPTVFH